MKHIRLTRGMIAKVDDEDYEQMSKHKWSLSHYGYAVRSTYTIKPGSHMLMHRQLMSAPVGTYIDHINGDKLDNRRSNLRFATFRQNLANKPVRSDSKLGIKGVRIIHYVSGPKYQVRFCKQYIGEYATLKEAADMYDKLASAEFGEYAKLNTLQESYA